MYCCIIFLTIIYLQYNISNSNLETSQHLPAGNDGIAACPTQSAFWHLVRLSCIFFVRLLMLPLSHLIRYELYFSYLIHSKRKKENRYRNTDCVKTASFNNSLIIIYIRVLQSAHLFTYTLDACLHSYAPPLLQHLRYI